MDLKPLNDVALIEIEKNPYQLGGMKLVSSQESEGVQSGIVLQLPELLLYLGFHAFAFESSLADTERLKEIAKAYLPLVGKRVYWVARSDMGVVLEKEDKSYALIKLTDFIAVSEPDVIYTNPPKKGQL